MSNNSEKKMMEVLVGDDQIGVEGSLDQKCFLQNYGGLADFEFSSIADDFIEKARTGNYDAFLIDLNLEKGDNSREYKTGFSVLEAVKEYAPIRLLHTSDETYREIGMRYGARNCIEKHRSRKYLENALYGGR